MSLPIKVTNKNKEAMPAYVAVLNQALSKNYYKLYKKNTASNKGTKNKSDNFSQESNTLQESIVKWFFSLDTRTKGRICSIPNRNLVTILTQMYMHSTLDTRVKFRLKTNGRADDDEEYIPIKKEGDISLVSVSINSLSYLTRPEPLNPSHYLHYFEPSNSVQTTIILNNFLKHNESCEKEFLKEVEFYHNEVINDTVTLSMNFLKDEESFKSLFSYFSNDRYFKSPIEPEYEEDLKFYSLNMPGWFNTKEYFSFCQILVALFESLISVWFQIYKWTSLSTFEALLDSEVKLSSLLEEVEKVVKFLKRKMISNNEKRKLLEEINYKGISIELRKDEKVAEMISIKKRLSENVYHNLYNSLYLHHPYDKRTTSEILEEALSNVRNNFYVMNDESFVMSLLFTKFDRIFSYEDFLSKRMFREIHNLYTNENALSLMNEESNLNSGVNTRKFKKIIKKTKKVKREEEVEVKKLEERVEESLNLNSIPNWDDLKPIESSNEGIGITTLNTGKVDPEQPAEACEKGNTNRIKIKEKRNFYLYNVNAQSKNDCTTKIVKDEVSNENKDKNEEGVVNCSNQSEPPISLNESTIEKIETKQVNIISNIQPQKFELEITNNATEVSKSINITINTPVYNNYYIINSQKKEYFPKERGQTNGWQPALVDGYEYAEESSYQGRPYYSGVTNPFYINSGAIHDPYSGQPDFNRIHNDIVNYSMSVNENILALKEIKFSVIRKLESIIRASLSEFKINLYLYGSFATDLEIESSDIDISVNYECESMIFNSYLSGQNIIDSLIKKLTRSLEDKRIFISVIPIYTASVPVIKLQVYLPTFLDYEAKMYYKSYQISDNYQYYPFNRDELDKVKIDLTFLETKSSDPRRGFNNTIGCPSLRIVQLIKSYLLLFPEIKPLMHVLKRILQLEKMNSCFNGGLSSFCVFLLVFAFLKVKKINSNFNYGKENLGNLLLQFFDFYSNFDFNYTFIDVNSSNPFITSNTVLEKVPLILDPITYLNVGKNSYRIEEIKKVFSSSSSLIFNILSNNVYNERRSNSIYSLFSLLDSR